VSALARIAALALALAVAPGSTPAAAQPSLAPGEFAAGRYEAAAAPLLAAIEALEAQVPSDRQRAVAPLIVSAFADNRRVPEAWRRALAISAGPGQAYALGLTALAQALDGDAAGARVSIAGALAADPGRDGLPGSGGSAIVLAIVWARLGEGERALAAAEVATGTQRIIALTQVAVTGPTGRSDAPPERAFAHVRGWTPPATSANPPEPPDVAAAALANIGRVLVRYGEGEAALERIATIADPAWRALALLWAAAEFGAHQQPGLADRALRQAEGEIGNDLLLARGVPADRMRRIALPWLAYARARLGDGPGAGRALATAIAAIERVEGPEQRLVALAQLADMIGRTRQHIAEAQARAQASTPPAAPAPPPVRGK
jgi:hypothetical protein